jgi:hypothetical protein
VTRTDTPLAAAEATTWLIRPDVLVEVTVTGDPEYETPSTRKLKMVPPALNPGAAVCREPLRSELANWTTAEEPVIWTWIEDVWSDWAGAVVDVVVVAGGTEVVEALDLCRAGGACELGGVDEHPAATAASSIIPLQLAGERRRSGDRRARR